MPVPKNFLRYIGNREPANLESLHSLDLCYATQAASAVSMIQLGGLSGAELIGSRFSLDCFSFEF